MDSLALWATSRAWTTCARAGPTAPSTAGGRPATSVRDPRTTTSVAVRHGVRGADRPAPRRTFRRSWRAYVARRPPHDAARHAASCQHTHADAQGRERPAGPDTATCCAPRVARGGLGGAAARRADAARAAAAAGQLGPAPAGRPPTRRVHAATCWRSSRPSTRASSTRLGTRGEISRQPFVVSGRRVGGERGDFHALERRPRGARPSIQTGTNYGAGRAPDVARAARLHWPRSRARGGGGGRHSLLRGRPGRAAQLEAPPASATSPVRRLAAAGAGPRTSTSSARCSTARPPSSIELLLVVLGLVRFGRPARSRANADASTAAAMWPPPAHTHTPEFERALQRERERERERAAPPRPALSPLPDVPPAASWCATSWSWMARSSACCCRSVASALSDGSFSRTAVSLSWPCARPGLLLQRLEPALHGLDLVVLAPRLARVRRIPMDVYPRGTSLRACSSLRCCS